MELTKHAHEEFQSSRRVTEATYGPMGDAEWCMTQIDSLDSRGILEMPELQRFQQPHRLWVYWLVMVTLGPPTVSGIHCALRDRAELRLLHESYTAGKIPTQSTMGKFLRKMGENINAVRAYLMNQADIGITPRLNLERRLLVEVAETGIMILEHHRDLVTSGEPADAALQEKVRKLSEFAGATEDQREPQATREQADRLVAMRDRIIKGERLEPEMESKLTEIGRAIMHPDPRSPQRPPEVNAIEEK